MTLRMQKQKSQSGFTLIEVVIVTFLFSILLLGLLNLYDWHQKVYLLEQAEVKTTGSIRTAFNEMTRHIAQGTEIIASRTVNGQAYNSGSGALIVEIPAINSSNNYIPNVYDYVTYYLSGTNLYQVVEPGAGSVRPGRTYQMSTSVESLSFTYNNVDPTAASQVTVLITATASTRGDSSVTAQASDTIFLRNR